MGRGLAGTHVRNRLGLMQVHSCRPQGSGRWGRIWARLVVVMFAGVLLASCGGDAFNLFGSKDDLPPDEPADKLYNEGVFLLNEEKDYKAAAKKFEEVDRQHPYSEWARKSLIMSAYAYY
jgi:outer membrane protein assembly factor BamD